MSRCWLCGFLLDSHNVSKLRDDGCNRCFPDYDGGVKGVSKTKGISPDVLNDFVKPSTPIRHSKKNVGKRVQVRVY